MTENRRSQACSDSEFRRQVSTLLVLIVMFFFMVIATIVTLRAQDIL